MAAPKEDVAGKHEKAYEFLKQVRASKTVTLKPTAMLRSEIVGLDGTTQPLKIRYYQVQAIMHLLTMKRMVLGDATGTGKCVTGDTMILTDRGYVPIRDLAPDVELQADTAYEIAPVSVWTGSEMARVKCFYWNGLAKTRRLRTHSGFEIEGSLNHPVLVRNTEGEEVFKRLADVAVGDQLCVSRSLAPFPTAEPKLPHNSDLNGPRTKRYAVPECLSPSLARLLGYVVAEAWSNSSANLIVTQHREINPEAHDDIRSLFLELFGWSGNQAAKTRDMDVNVSSTHIRRFFLDCGVPETTSHFKDIPWCIGSATRESTRQFLRGLFEGEGSVDLSAGGLEFPSSSERLARGVHLLLLRFGIVSALRPRYVKKYNHVYWRVTMFGDAARLFASEIGFVSTRKQEALTKVLNRPSNSNKDVVPHTARQVQALRAALLANVTRHGSNAVRTGSGLKPYGRSFNSTLSHIGLKYRNPTFRFLRVLLQAAKDKGLEAIPAYVDLHRVVANYHFYEAVSEVTDGEDYVMDLEVDHPKHCFVGNGLINHNTLVLIASLCYAWDKEPTNKGVVVCPKSALRQWEAEILRFATGIKTFLVDGTPAERKEVYEAFQAHPTTPGSEKAVLLIGYAPMVRDWNVGSTRPLLPSGQPNMKVPQTPGLLSGIMGSIPNLTVTYDECFYYYTPVVLATGGTELIGKLVSKNRTDEVLSWNWTTGTLEAKPIVAWYRKPLVYGKRRTALLTIKFRLSGVVKVTPSHVFYRTDGSEVVSGGLKVGQDTAALDLNAPSLDQEQLVLGSLLGDSSVDRHSLVWGVSCGHSTAQERYVDFKRTVLQSLGVSDLTRYQTEFQSGTQQMVRFRLDSNKTITSRLRNWGVIWQGKKTLTYAWLENIGPLGLAFWYGDDGNLGTHLKQDGASVYNISLHTEGYTKEENELLVGWLNWKWGVAAEIRTTPRRKGREGHYHYIYMPHPAAVRFLGLLPGALPGVEYKFLPGTRVLSPADLDSTPRQLLVKDEVLSIGSWEPSANHKAKGQNRYVYDLEVADNHNYFANGTLVSNCTAFKSTKTKTWQVASELSAYANRCYGLTATLLKNNLIEGFAIFKVIYPQVFTTITAFLRDYCVTKMQPVGGGRKIPIVVGYKNLEAFRARIDMFFLGRAKHLISDELPKLITKEVQVDLSESEDAKYIEALTGILQLGDGQIKDYEEHKKLVALIYCQQTVDSLSLLKYKEGDELELGLYHDEIVKVEGVGSKEQALLDLLVEEFDDEKVIVYTRFASLVPRLQELCKKEGIESVAVTGQVVDTKANPARQKAQQAFQDLTSKVRVIFITDAGSEAINLQAASAMIFYNAPWSWGNYVQLLGRPIRIGSPHQHVVAVHLVAQRPKAKGKERKTIDHYTLAILQKKKDLIDKVLGESAVGALDFDSGESFAHLLMDELQKSVRGPRGVTKPRAT